jgi:hypothetical protein
MDMGRWAFVLTTNREANPGRAKSPRWIAFRRALACQPLPCPLSSNKNRQAFGITKQQGNELLLLLSFNDDGVRAFSAVVWSGRSTG